MAKLVYPTSMPYDEINIVDNSIYEDNVPGTVSGVPTGPIAYIPFISPRGYGDDNKLVFMTADRLGRYGTPNLKKYGLSLYLANRFVEGGGTILGMRVVPAYVAEADGKAAHGASYANACVFALVNDTSKTITYGVTAVQADKPLDNFIAATDATLNGADIPEGSTLYKLFVIRAKAAGDFANNFYFRLAADAAMNTLAEESGYNAYFYRFSDSDGGETLDGNMTFTFAEGFQYDAESMDPEDVFDTYSENVVFEKVVTGTNNLDDFLSAISFTGEENILFPEKDENGKYKCGEFEVDNTAIDATIHLRNAVPVWVDTFDWDSDPFADDLAMAYGNCGNAPTVPNGIYTDLIYDEIRYPFQYMFAPSYDTKVVKSIHQLVADKHLTHANYIVPYRSTYTAQKTVWAAETVYVACNSWKEVVVPEWLYVRDPYTGKKTRMPAVYMDAYGYPKHWNEKKGKPYAGAANYSWLDYITGTVTPATSSAEQYIANHKTQFNTMIEDGYGNAVPYEQITRQTVTSALSEINNTYILTDMIRIALAVANSKRWSDLSDEAIVSYKDDVYNAINSELGSCYDYIDIVTARESLNGAGRNRIRCSITVKFKDILKGVSYTFYISAT